MRFESLTIDNKFIHMPDQTLDFCNTGVYMISGPNGSGKSTLLQRIVFGKKHSVQNTPEHQEAYEENRASLISYVPQQIPAPEISVFDYVTKGNPHVTEENICRYMDIFGLEGTDLKLNVTKLSGGEQTKLYIISALLKETPYIILDEPTNNLDDGSVRTLCRVLTEIGKERTVILSTHDPRMKPEGAYSVKLDSAGIHQEPKEVRRNEFPLPELPKISFLRLNLKLQKKRWTLSGNILFLLMITVLLLFNIFYFSMNYSVEEEIEPGSILLYMSDYTYAELNQIYAEGEGLSIGTSRYDSLVQYDDIPLLAEIDGVEDIYIFNNRAYEEICDSIEEGGDAAVLSVPEIICKNYLDTVGLYTLLALEEGTVPEDNASEVAMSESMLKELYGITDPTSALGTVLDVNGKSCTLTGITSWDIYWVSYDSGTSSLFYCYNASDYEEFSSEEMAYLAEIDAAYLYEPDDILLIVEEEKEQEILNEVMAMYPANNYYSSAYTASWKSAYNQIFMRKAFLLNLIFAAVGSIVMILISRMVLAEDFVLLEDYRAYYILDRRIRRSYLLSRLLIKIVPLAVFCVLDFALSGSYRMNALLLAMAGAIMVLADFAAAAARSMKEQSGFGGPER